MDKILANGHMGVHFVFFDEAEQPVQEYTQAIDSFLPLTLAEGADSTLPDDFIGPPNKPGKKILRR